MEIENQPEMEIERSVQVTSCNPEMDRACMEVMQLAARHENTSVQVKKRDDSVVFTLKMSGKHDLVKEKRVTTRGIGSKYRRKERRRQEREAASSGYDTDEQQHSTAPTSPTGTTTSSRRSSASSVSTISTLQTTEAPSS